MARSAQRRPAGPVHAPPSVLHLFRNAVLRARTARRWPTSTDG
ncbi:hypothetical protein NKH77_12030 [Streptomyces sp. M19]